MSGTTTTSEVALSPAMPGDMVGLDELDGSAVPNWVELEARRGSRRVYRWMGTSEGIDVAMPLAPLGARLLGFVLDHLMMILIGIGIVMLAAIFGSAGLPGIGISFAVLSFFLVRYFYFVVFETLSQGRTPGKRAARTRVVNRHGQPLTVEAIFVRNVTRDLEVLLPLVVLIQPAALFPNAPAWGLLLSGAWLLVFALFPLFNRDRMRVGDLLAGTLVVRTRERVQLVDDPAIGTFMRVRNERPLYGFSPQQLDAYGIFEVQALEDVLAQGPNRRPADEATLATLGRTIRHKIGWSDQGAIEEWQFLHDFYAAARARHERRMMLGQRQPFKRDGRLESSANAEMIVRRHSGVIQGVAAASSDGSSTASASMALDAAPTPSTRWRDAMVASDEASAMHARAEVQARTGPATPSDSVPELESSEASAPSDSPNASSAAPAEVELDVHETHDTQRTPAVTGPAPDGDDPFAAPAAPWLDTDDPEAS